MNLPWLYEDVKINQVKKKAPIGNNVKNFPIQQKQLGSKQ